MALIVAEGEHGRYSKIINRFNWKANLSLDPDVMNQSAMKGNICTVKWLRELDCQWKKDYVMLHAAYADQLDMIKWLRGNGCPYNQHMFSVATERSSMKTLEYLRDDGCPWDKHAIASAKYSGRTVVVEWLRDNGCPE